MSRLVDIESYEDCRIVLNEEDEGVRCRDLPTVDAAEEKQGNWCAPYWYEIPRIFDKRMCVICSTCKKKVFMFGDELTYTFCPHCGAKNLRR